MNYQKNLFFQKGSYLMNIFFFILSEILLFKENTKNVQLVYAKNIGRKDK